MTKFDEMWAALAAYQPQADACGHGKSWARMCSEKTGAAANAADAVAAYAANDAAAANAARAAANAAYAAARAAANAAYAAAANAADSADSAKWAGKAIDRINEVLEIQPAPVQPGYVPLRREHMTQDIIAMAREAGIADAFLVTPHPGVVQQLERFAELVRADERDRATRENAYVLAEREACAKVCETDGIGAKYQGDVYAEAIRARGQA
jgi:hypothetical protein